MRQAKLFALRRAAIRLLSRPQSTTSGVEREIELEHIDARLAQQAERAAFDLAFDQCADTLLPAGLRALATRGTWKSAASGEMSGSRPLPEVVTRSTGTGADGFSFLSLSTSPLTRSASALLVGPRFEPIELAAL